MQRGKSEGRFHIFAVCALLFPGLDGQNISGIFEHKKDLNYSEFLLDLQFVTATIYLQQKEIVKENSSLLQEKERGSHFVEFLL